VDLPAPDAPTSATVSPASIEKKPDPEPGVRFRIAEPDGSEFDFALRAADLARSGIGLGPLVDQAKYALRRGEPPLQGLVDAGQPAQRRKHQQLAQ